MIQEREVTRLNLTREALKRADELNVGDVIVIQNFLNKRACLARVLETGAVGDDINIQCKVLNTYQLIDFTTSIGNTYVFIEERLYPNQYESQKYKR